MAPAAPAMTQFLSMACTLTEAMQFAHFRSNSMRWTTSEGESYDILFDDEGSVVAKIPVLTLPEPYFEDPGDARDGEKFAE